MTGADLAERGLAWMPTLSADVQAVLATDKVRFQGQEIAFVVARDRYSARDALELIAVEYEPLPPVIDALTALDAGAAVVRDDLPGRTGNHIFDWTAGDKAATDAVFAAADVIVGCDMVYPRSHPAPLETCGIVADLDAVSGRLTLWSTTQAPHAHRTMYAMVTGLPEHKIRIVSPDLGGGFGNKVPVYPGYLCAIVGVDGHRQAGEVDGGPVGEPDVHLRSPATTTCTARSRPPGTARSSACGPGCWPTTARSTRPRVPTKFPAGFFHIFTGSYDLQAAYCEVTGVYTNKAPGGVAYSCSFRITEAVYLVERLVDLLARELGMRSGRAADAQPAAARAVPLYLPDRLAVRLGRLPAGARAGAGDRRLRRTAARAGRTAGARRVHGHRAVSFFTEGVGAGPREHMDILGLGMADGADLRVHPTGKAVLAISVQTQGQGHETTFAQIVAHELGLSPDDVEVVHGDTDRTPFGLGHLRLAVHAGVGRGRGRWPRARSASGPGSSPRRCSRCPRTTWSGPTASGGCAATPSRRAASPRSRWPRTPRWRCRTESRGTWTPRPSITRRT